VKASKRFFFEKKAPAWGSKKLLSNWATGAAASTVGDRKFFASFFQKRSAFL